MSGNFKTFIKRNRENEQGFALLMVMGAATILAVVGIAYSNLARNSLRSAKHGAIVEDVFAMQKIVRDAFADPAQCYTVYRNHAVNGNACANGAAFFNAKQNYAISQHVPGTNDI